MIVFHSRKLIFFKSYKTAGTAIEFELSKQLGSEDVQLPFGYGADYFCGQNAESLKINYLNILKNPRIFLVLAKQMLKNIAIVHEHIDPEVFDVLFPAYSGYTKISVYRDSHDTNYSNYRMYVRRYGIDCGYDDFIKSNYISNALFKRSRSGKPINNLHIFQYNDLNSLISFLSEYELNLKLDIRINS